MAEDMVKERNIVNNSKNFGLHKKGGFLDYLGDYKFLEKDSVPRNLMVGTYSVVQEIPWSLLH
jgi:hypothetical protein